MLLHEYCVYVHVMNESQDAQLWVIYCVSLKGDLMRGLALWKSDFLLIFLNIFFRVLYCNNKNYEPTHFSISEWLYQALGLKFNNTE